MQAVEKRGKSVDEAIALALIELQCNRDETVIEILEEPEKGFLGIFAGKPACVRVTRKEVDLPAAQPTEEIKASTAEYSAEEIEDEVRDLVENILDKVQLDYQIDTLEYDGERVRVNFVGEDMGLLIGHKGETLNSVQLIVGLIFNRHRTERVRIILDVENYRKEREKALHDLALRMADKVEKTGKSVIMRPMTAQERRIVHTALQQEKEVTTYSTGTEPSRKVVIALKRN